MTDLGLGGLFEEEKEITQIVDEEGSSSEEGNDSDNTP